MTRLAIAALAFVVGAVSVLAIGVATSQRQPICVPASPAGVMRLSIDFGPVQSVPYPATRARCYDPGTGKPLP